MWSQNNSGFTRKWAIHRNIRHLPHPPGKELVSGESALYLGRQYRIEVVKTGLSDIQFSHRFMIPAQGKKATEALREWYISKAKEKIVPRVKLHARELGVDVAKVKIVDNLFRWGSCTANDNVNFNWRLIKAPMFVIDYVIVHELSSPYRGQPHTQVLEYRPRANFDHGKG